MIKRVLQIAQSSKGLQQSFITVIGNTFATGVAAISLILISRILGPSLFGEFSFGFALVMIISRINELGLNSALLKYIGKTSNIKKWNIYFSISLKTKLIFSLIIILLGISGYQWLNTFFNLSHPEIILVAFTLGLSTVYLEHLNVILQSLHKFNQAVLSSILQALVKVVGTIIFILMRIKDVSLLFSFYVFAPIVPMIFYKMFLPNKIKISIKLNGEDEKNNLFDMAKHAGLANISTVLVSQLSVIFVQAYLTSYETGILGGVSKIQMLFSLIASSLGTVLFPRVSRYNKKSDLLIFIKKAFILVFIIFLGLLVSIGLAKPFILLSIGPEYLPGLTVLYILLTAVFTTIATIPFTALFYSFENNRYFSVSGILQVVLILIGNTILIPKFGLLGTAYTQILTRLTVFFITIIWGICSYIKKADD